MSLEMVEFTETVPQATRPQGSARLWDVLASQVEACGLRLFDLDMPTSRHGTLRVFITRAHLENNKDPSDSHTARVAGVTLEDCVRVSKSLSEFMDSPQGAEWGLSSTQWELEVSSPGINRSLKRPEHFVDAIGERVSITFKANAVQIEPISADNSGNSSELESEGPQSLDESAPTESSTARRRLKKAAVKQAKREREMSRIRERRVITGVLERYSDNELSVVTDNATLRARIPVTAVTHARVDFLFANRER